MRNKKENNMKYCYMITNTRILHSPLKKNGIQERRKHLHTELDFRTFTLALLSSWCVMVFNNFLLYDIASLRVALRPKLFGVFKRIIYVCSKYTSLDILFIFFVFH